MIPFTRVIAPALLAAALIACEYISPSDREPPAMDSVRVLPSVPDTVRDQVLAELEQYYVDFSARDWDRFADHFWEDATLTTIWQPSGDSLPRVIAITVPEFVAQAPLGPGSREIFRERMTSAVVLGNDNLAQVWVTYEAMFGDPGAMEEWTGEDAFTLMKHEGRWRIVALAYRSNR